MIPLALPWVENVPSAVHILLSTRVITHDGYCCARAYFHASREQGALKEVEGFVTRFREYEVRFVYKALTSFFVLSPLYNARQSIF